MGSMEHRMAKGKMVRYAVTDPFSFFIMSSTTQ